LERAASAQPFASARDHDGAAGTLWRLEDPALIATLRETLAGGELLIADGHHRYETARVYAEEVGGEGEHRYALMFLCSLADPGLTIFPTHRLLTDLSDDAKRAALTQTLERDFESSPIEPD